jgi:hypothetical protein
LGERDSPTFSRSSASRTAAPDLCTYSVGYGICGRPGATGTGPVPTGSIGQEIRQAFRSGGRAKLSCEGIIEPVMFGSLRSLRPLKEDLRTSGHGVASEYGSSSSRRRQIEYRSVRVLELQPHRSPRQQPVRQGARTRWWGFTRRSSPHGKVQ